MYSATGAQVGSFASKNIPAFSGNMSFMLGSNGGSFGTLEGRNLDTNTVAWSFVGDGSLISAPLVVNECVYIGSNSGKLFALEKATGQQVWSANAGAAIPQADEQSVSQQLTGFAAGEGLLVIPTKTTLVAYEGDHIAPTLAWGSQTPAANASGWNNTPVDLPFTMADELSGVASSDPQNPLHFYAEGANQTQQVTITDKAGNSATFTSPPVNIDLTAPSTSAVLSNTGTITSWVSGPVQVTLTASDALSGIANTFYSVDGSAAQTYTGAFTVANAGLHTLLFWSKDQANNTEAQNSLSFKLDSGAPLINVAASPSSAPKRNAALNVTISGSVTDTPSGVKPGSATYAVVDEYGVKQPTGSVFLQSNGSYSFTLSLPATRNNKDSDGHKYTITVRAADQAGNTGAASTVVTIL